MYNSYQAAHYQRTVNRHTHTTNANIQFTQVHFGTQQISSETSLFRQLITLLLTIKCIFTQKRMQEN